MNASINHAKHKVYIILLNWNGETETNACITSLMQLDYPNFEIVVCDNNSKNDSYLAIQEFIKSLATSCNQSISIFDSPKQAYTAAADLKNNVLTFIQTGANLGFAGGMNVGVRFAQLRADATYYWLLNNDTEVATTALTELVTKMHDDNQIGICGSTLIEFEDRAKVQALGGAAYTAWKGRSRALGAFTDLHLDEIDTKAIESQMGYVVGASMLISNQTLDKVGLMDESYFLYSEEHDWAWRVMKHGMRLGYAKNSLVFHKHGASIGTSPSGGSELSLFYLYRAKLMFAIKNHPHLLITVLAFLLLDATKLLIKGYPRKFKAALKGLLACTNNASF